MTVLLLGVAPPNYDVPGANGGPAFVGTDSGRRLARIAGLDSDEELSYHYVLRNIWEDPIEELTDLDEARLRVTAMVLSLNPAAVVALGVTPARLLGLRTDWLVYQTLELGGRKYPAYALPHPSGRTIFWNESEHRADARALLEALRGSTVR